VEVVDIVAEDDRVAARLAAASSDSEAEPT
jgi:hypothetical protein